MKRKHEPDPWRNSKRPTSSRFDVQARHFTGKFPYFREPKEVGCFSLDGQRLFLDDSSRLRCYHPPENTNNTSFDLRKGYREFIQRNETDKEYIDNLLQWVMLHRDKFLPQGETGQTDSLFTDFISWRGLMTRLLCTPYENREGWKISVIKYKGTLYMCEYETEEKVRQLQQQTDMHKEMCYWGFKFEQYVTADSKDTKPDTSPPVNNSEAFCSVVRSRLDKHSLVFGAEVDCFGKKDGKYLELKTSREISNERQHTNFKRFKLIKWWAQSFLAGIPKIICGFRDDEGVVEYLEDFKLSRITEMIKDVPNIWEPSVCFNFCNQFLSFVKQVVVKDDHRIAYVFEWHPGSPVTWREYPPSSEYVFLPDWYLKSWEKEPPS